MGRFSPTVLPQGSNLGDAIGNAARTFLEVRSGRRQEKRQDEADAREKDRYQHEQAARPLEDATREAQAADAGVIRTQDAKPVDLSGVPSMGGMHAEVRPDQNPNYRPLGQSGYTLDLSRTASARADRAEAERVAEARARQDFENRTLTETQGYHQGELGVRQAEVAERGAASARESGDRRYTADKDFEGKKYVADHPHGREGDSLEGALLARQKAVQAQEKEARFKEDGARGQANQIGKQAADFQKNNLPGTHDDSTFYNNLVSQSKRFGARADSARSEYDSLGRVNAGLVSQIGNQQANAGVGGAAGIPGLTHAAPALHVPESVRPAYQKAHQDAAALFAQTAKSPEDVAAYQRAVQKINASYGVPPQ